MSDGVCLCTISDEIQYVNPACPEHRDVRQGTATDRQCICDLSSSDRRDCRVSHIVPPNLARREVSVALNKLRYGASVPCGVPVDTEQNEVEFLIEVAEWLTSFGEVLAAVSDTTTDMASELQELRRQRKAVRDFLGLNTMKGITE